MNSAQRFTLTFLEQAPAHAARVLQAMPVEQAAAYLESVPARLAGPVLTVMTPWHAARVLERIRASRTALILRQLVFSDTTTLVRLMLPDGRARVLDELPTNYAQRLSRSLQYPPHVVGAWIDPGVPMLAPSNTVDDALAALRATGTASDVFLAAENGGEYAGTIAVREILRSEATSALAQLPAVTTKPVSSRTLLSSVAFDARWDELLCLPVVDRRGHLLGGLSRRTLRKAVHEEPAAAAREFSLIGSLIDALVLTSVGLSRLLTDGFERGGAGVMEHANER